MEELDDENSTLGPIELPELVVKGKAPLGKWCSYQEATYSDTAIAHGIPNTPNAAQWANMLLVYETIYAPLCEHYLYRLPISSFFRSPSLNKVIPGASDTSAHTLGQAIDIDCDGLSFLTNLELLTYIRANFVFDQLILEHPDKKTGNPRWVHVSFRANGKNRQQVLRARIARVTVKGKVVEKTAYDVI
ncbi:D-Ala-D-Ala carboxypeptidase family metallohydrolase [Fibrella aquatica]|uniref:D-Ala-D-Ala carboxypeptidase family metallohydrolase n=1 Tax=Fibrella aquatica TaxID=3242487 RepID=UPI0035229DCD